MKHPAAIVSALCLMGLLSFSHVRAAVEGPLATGPSTAGAVGKLGPPALEKRCDGPITIRTAGTIDAIECLSKHSLNQRRLLGWKD